MLKSETGGGLLTLEVLHRRNANFQIWIDLCEGSNSTHKFIFGSGGNPYTILLQSWFSSFRWLEPLFSVARTVEALRSKCTRQNALFVVDVLPSNLGCRPRTVHGVDNVFPHAELKKETVPESRHYFCECHEWQPGKHWFNIMPILVHAFSVQRIAIGLKIYASLSSLRRLISVRTNLISSLEHVAITCNPEAVFRSDATGLRWI